MKRHSFDPTSFLAGLVLAAIAGAYLAAQHSSWDVDGRWVFPVALIGLGIAGVAGALSGSRGREDIDVTAVPPGDASAPAPPPE